MIGLGLREIKRIKKPDDFYVAGKSGSTFTVTGSLLATILGSSAILGTINWGAQKGWASAWMLISASIGMLLLIPVSKYVRRFGKYTLPQLLGDFYGDSAKRIASIIIPVAWIGIIAAQIIGSAKILNGLTGLEYTFGVLISGFVIIAYTTLGGQKSILKTDSFQSLFIIIGLIALSIYIYQGLNEPISSISGLHFPFNENFNSWDLIILLLTYSTTFVVGPDIYSRLFCAKNENVAAVSSAITALVLVLMAFVLAFIGVYSAWAYPEVDSSKSFSFLHTLLNHYPAWLNGLLIAALLSAVMSSADTTLLTASIILSDFRGKGNLKLKTTRIFIVVLGVLAIVFALKITSIISSLLLALTFFSGAFIIPTAAGLLGYRATPLITNSAILVGGFTALAGKLILMYADYGRLGYYLIFAAFSVNAVILFIPSIFRLNNGTD